MCDSFLTQANSLGLSASEIKPLGLFTQTPIGLALVAAAILYFIFMGKVILPKSGGDEALSSILPASIAESYQKKGVEYLFEICVPADYSRMETIQAIKPRTKFHVAIVGIFSPDTRNKNYAPSKMDEVKANQTLAVLGNRENVDLFCKACGFRLKDALDVFAEDLSPNNAGIMEGIVTPRSELINYTMDEIDFRKTYGVVPILIHCQDGFDFDAISTKHLEPGDAILMFGRWEKFHQLKDESTFTFTTEIKGEIMREEKATTALFWLGAALFLVAGFEPLMNLLGFPGVKLSLSICLLTGALGMILTKVMTVDEAYHSVDWMTVFLLAGLIPLGLAFQKTGAAGYIAASIMNIIGTVPSIVFLLVVGLLTSFFTLVVSNVGATVLLVPLCMSMALKTGADPRITAMVVALSASNTFVLPTHQVNALIMRPGGYKTMDYAKSGAGMTILFLVVLLGMLYLFY